MEKLGLLFSLSLFFNIISFPIPSAAVSSCNSPCRTVNDCDGQLICIKGKCKDDPDVGTHTCSGGGGITPSPPSGGGGGTCHPNFKCSPPVPSSIPAKLTNNDFTEAGGSGPAECDERYHKNSERVVALSTGWYEGGSRCGKFIKITARNGKSTTAKVVDECDSRNGCGNNIVDGSDAVWSALGLNKDIGIVDVTCHGLNLV